MNTECNQHNIYSRHSEKLKAEKTQKEDQFQKLEKLVDLRKKGILTDEEFAKLKAKLIGA